MVCHQNRFDISFVIGDHYSFIVLRENEDGTPLPFAPGDTVFMSAKRKVKDTSFAFQKTITTFNVNKVQIDLEPDDTKHLDPGDYFFDIQLTGGDGRITTIVPFSILTLIPEITT